MKTKLLFYSFIFVVFMTIESCKLTDETILQKIRDAPDAVFIAHSEKQLSNFNAEKQLNNYNVVSKSAPSDVPLDSVPIESLPDRANIPKNGIRLPDMLQLPKDEDIEASETKAEKKAVEQGPVIVRPPDKKNN